MTKLQIKENGLSKEEWDDFVYSTPQGNVFSTYDWLRINSRNSESRLLTLQNNGEIVGALGIVNAYGQVSPPPLSQYNSLLLNLPCREAHKNDALNLQIQQELIDYLEGNFSNIRLVNHPTIKDIRVFQWKGWKEKIKSTYVVNLENLQSESLFYKPSLRRQINKKNRHNYVTEIGNDYPALTGLLEQSFQRHNARLFLDRKVLEDILDYSKLGNRGIQYTLKEGSKPVASVFFVLDKTGVAYYFTAGSDTNYLSSGVSSIVLNDALFDLHSKGIKSMDFGGAHHQSIAHFKSGFNPDLITYFEVKHEGQKYT